jgi:glycine/D-amino acid oxidase-like deaminating enzyme/nitrite reductase/ring-hydroxylating ferredoxin subunit
MIERDGFQSSIWQQTSEQFRADDKRTFKDIYDVIIVGGGITGVTIADALCRQGQSCLLLEAHSLCYGTTGGTTAHINTLLDVPYTQIIKNFDEHSAIAVCGAASRAIDTVRSNVRNMEVDCGWKEAAAFLFAETREQSEELQDIASACRKVGLHPESVNRIPVPIPFESAMKVGLQARFHPVRYVHALARRFENNGGKIVENCRVTGMKESDAEVEVETLQGRYRGRWIVLATHIPHTVNIIHMRCSPYRSYAMALKIREEQNFNDLVYDMRDPYHYYRMQEIDGENYLIAGGKDHKTGHERNTLSPMRELEAHVRKYFNVVSIEAQWSSQYYESADGLPYIGHFPGHSDRVLTATGFGGNGMTYSSVSCNVISDIIAGKKNFLIELFAPTRIKPIAGFKNFAINNLDVTKQMLGSIFRRDQIEGFADLAPGEGKIVATDEGKVAISKDDHGGVHAVNATCTHLGCKVAWNQFEKSWDCPCHGARYDLDGTVLNGPAVNNLEYINVEIIGSLTDH